MAAENRLTGEQLAALSPGDTVTIETSRDLRRPAFSSGTVARVEGPHIVVSCRSPRGVAYVHHFDRRDGVRIGGGHRAELVTTDPAQALSAHRPPGAARVDAAYRAWARNRANPELLRQLQAAVADALDEAMVSGR
jgi:hypothetical protein